VTVAGALEAFAAVVGSEHVLREGSELDTARRTTFRLHRRADAIVRPRDVEEVRACVRVANERRAALYPISRGLNLGYGSRVPPQDCVALLDLRRLDEIVAYDETLAYVTVQPGVTFGALAAFLAEKASPHFPSVHGGPPEASVLGHVLERGLGKGPYADRWLHACGFEVVLADGRLVHTGFGRFDSATTAPLTRTGPGPYLDGLFTQSGFGIVTEMTIWLHPRPAHAATFLFTIRKGERLAPTVDALRLLKLEGTLRSSCLLANDVRRMSFTRQYPWEEAAGVTPLPQAVREKLRRGVLWSGDGTVYGASKAQLEADRARIREILGPSVDDIVWSDEAREDSPIPPDVLRVVHSLNMGQPVPRTAATTYWRKKTPPPEDLNPDRDGCGFISFSPAVPFEGKHVRRVVDFLERTMVARGFDPSIGLNCVGERAIDLTPMILYDRDIPGEDDRAMACHDEMLEHLAKDGYYPYRLCTAAMDKLPSSRDDHDALHATLKRALDPNLILSPGRYEAGPRRT
jgi:4-cresol dehydrogenase (hydroxylating)